jgi:hypothetical protein
VFAARSASRLYDEDPSPPGIALRVSLETAVESDSGEMSRKELSCERRLHVCCSYSYNYCVKVHCQETESGDSNRMRTLVFVTVNCKM